MLLQRLHVIASVLQETMNSRCPINALPPEMLARIFSFVPRPLPLGARYRGVSSAVRTSDLIPISHVCRRWRDVALDTPSLWSSICETGSELARVENVTDVVHARAQQASLIVYVDRSRPSTALTELLHCPSDGARVTELHLHDLHDLTSAHLTADLLSFPAPRLQRAVVRRRPAKSTAADGDVATGSHAKPVDELFGGVAPRLQSLFWHDVPFLPSNWFESLTYLWLSLEASPIHWTLPDLVQLLHQTPALTEASMVGLPTHLLSPDTAVLLPATLPHLRRLEIGGCRGQESPIAVMRAILSNLVLSSTTACAVRLHAVDAHRLSPLTDVRIAFFEPPTRLAIDVSFTTLALTGTHVRSGHSLCLELNTAGATRSHLHQCIEAFLASAPAPAILEVTIASQRVWPSWCDPSTLLSMLPNVTDITLSDAHLVNELLEALRPPAGPRRSCAGISRVMCPSLVTLHVPFGLTDLLMQQLRSVLAERVKYGSRMRCLMVDCSISC